MAAAKRHRAWISRTNLTPIDEKCKERRQQRNEEEDKQSSVVPRLKKWRLIVRNLGHRFDERDMRKQFAQHGRVKEAVFGRSKQGIILSIHLCSFLQTDANTYAGYAFVQYTTEAEAESAMQYFNANHINGRRVTVAYAVPKEKHVQAIVEDG